MLVSIWCIRWEGERLMVCVFFISGVLRLCRFMLMWLCDEGFILSFLMMIYFWVSVLDNWCYCVYFCIYL